MKIVAVASVAAMTLAGCGSSTDSTSGASGKTSAAKAMKIGMAYDVGGRGDQSFNDAAAAGLDKAKKDLGVVTKEATAVNAEPESAREERLQQLIDAGYTSVIAVGFAYAPSVKKVAAANPDVKFALIDSTDATGPNIENLTFAENEGSFLVGAAAALKSKTGNIGFIGGVNVDLIKKFEAGYVMGAKTVNPAIKVQVKYLTQPPDFSGFGDPAKGKIAAAGMYQQGADVVYAAAGGSGGGVFTAARATCCGVDHVCTLLVHARGRDLALGRVTEAREVRRLGEVLDLDLDSWVDRLGAHDVASLELLDEVDVDATDETDVGRLGLQSSRSTHEERALVLGEREVLDVGAGRVRGVDKSELDVRVCRGNLLDRRGVGESDGNDALVAGVDELQQTLLARGLGLTIDRRGLLGNNAQLGLRLVEAGGGGVVERLVSAPTHVIGHADLQSAGGSGRTTAGARRLIRACAAASQCQRGDRQRGRNLHHPTQGNLLR